MGPPEKDEKADYSTIFSGPSQLTTTDVAVFAVPPNFFNVVNSDYYVQTGVQKDVQDIEELPTGAANPVQMIYSDEDLSEYPPTKSDNNKNAYNITFRVDGNSPYDAQYGTSKTFGVVIPRAL